MQLCIKTDIRVLYTIYFKGVVAYGETTKV